MLQVRGFGVWMTIFFLSATPSVFADNCDEVFARGKEIFEAATTAGEKKDFEIAIQLFGEAEKCFKQVSTMAGCENASINITAGQNVGLCRSNAAKLQKLMEKVDSYNKESQEIATYNQATSEYNRGVTAFNNREWDAASDALESAAAIWESISSGKSKNGKLAGQYARKARKMAELARQYKYQ